MSVLSFYEIADRLFYHLSIGLSMFVFEAKAAKAGFRVLFFTNITKIISFSTKPGLLESTYVLNFSMLVDSGKQNGNLQTLVLAECFLDHFVPVQKAVVKGRSFLSGSRVVFPFG